MPARLGCWWCAVLVIACRPWDVCLWLLLLYYGRFMSGLVQTRNGCFLLLISFLTLIIMKRVSNLTFYAPSTITVISGQEWREIIDTFSASTRTVTFTLLLLLFLTLFDSLLRAAFQCLHDFHFCWVLSSHMALLMALTSFQDHRV